MKFKTKLHLACKQKGLNDQFAHVFFRGEFIYVSNGLVHIKQAACLQNIAKGYMKILDGRKIHRDALRMINQQKEFTLSRPGDTVKACFDIGTSAVALDISHQTDRDFLFLDQIDKFFADWEMDTVREIAFPPEGLEIIRKVFASDTSGMTFRFNKKKQGILVTPNKDNYLEHAIIKPRLITGKLNEEL